MKKAENIFQVEKVVTIGVQTPNCTDEDLQESNHELIELIKTDGGVVVGSLFQKKAKLDRSEYLGRGKVQELEHLIIETGASVVVADDELSALQVKKLEDALGIKVIDRTTIILDIFANHASTREGILQVKLASSQYLLPRLIGGYTGLSRQRGGIGAKGPGETQLETDKRALRKRIKQLQEEIDQVVQNRKSQRSNRFERFAPLFSLVGYTNSGKSTLLNALSGSSVNICDGLFTTLDPTSRRIELPSGRFALLSDTVGFIQKLPHTLVKAFRATLEEILGAQLLWIVCDVSKSRFKEHIDTVLDVLREIGGLTLEKIVLFNKIDLPCTFDRNSLLNLFPGAMFISAKTGEGLNELKIRMDEIILRSFKSVELLLPIDSPLLKDIFRIGRVESQKWDGSNVLLQVELPNYFLKAVSAFVRN